MSKVVSNTSVNTPSDRLCVYASTVTVVIITILVDNENLRMSFTELQEKVPIDTIIITATSAAIGICLIQSLKNTTIINKKKPATKVDKRPRPPDLMLITD